MGGVLAALEVAGDEAGELGGACGREGFLEGRSVRLEDPIPLVSIVAVIVVYFGPDLVIGVGLDCKGVLSSEIDDGGRSGSGWRCSD